MLWFILQSFVMVPCLKVSFAWHNKLDSCLVLKLDCALHSWIIHSTSNEGLSYVDTSERYSFAYKFIQNIDGFFWKIGQLVPKLEVVFTI